MRAILISIKPEYVAKILNGEKTIEIRKTMPKCDLPIDVYIYCTKGNSITINMKTLLFRNPANALRNGKVVAKFTLKNVDEHHVLPTERILPFNWNVEKKLEQLCLTKEEVMAYGNGEDYQAFLWHISNLEIFDKPKELSEFYKVGAWKVYEEQFDSSYMRRTEQEIMKSLNQTLTKAPKSWCYIEVGEWK